MHDDYTEAVTLLDDLADMALAGHQVELEDCMEVLPASLILDEPWACMRVDLVFPALLEAVERQIRK